MIETILISNHTMSHFGVGRENVMLSTSNHFTLTQNDGELAASMLSSFICCDLNVLFFALFLTVTQYDGWLEKGKNLLYTPSQSFEDGSSFKYFSA
jgi:hypothetical protein